MNACPQMAGDDSPQPIPAEIIDLAWENVKARAAAELADAKAIFGDIEEQARRANFKRRAPLEVYFETRNCRVSGQWPDGMAIEFTAAISCPVGSDLALYRLQAEAKGRAFFGDGYVWDVEIL